ncbi:hypothetical protein EYV94_10280 [Puteibacter caeruleilacunae]|nr:hypothetical protein EYV94_10280 [Puteibacter caeruleilacunae]
MMKNYIVILSLLVLWGCDKGDALQDIDQSFSDPDTAQSGDGSDTDDAEYNRLVNYRTYVFAGNSNTGEEHVLSAGADASVKYGLDEVFLPDGDVVEKENYSLQSPMAVELNGITTLFFNRSLNGKTGTNSASGWCYSTLENNTWGKVTEVRKYAPYGYEKDGVAALGATAQEILWASKGVMISTDSHSWDHKPEALAWDSRDLSDFDASIGGDISNNMEESEFGLMMMSESFVEVQQVLSIGEIKYDTLDMDGDIPIYGTTPVDTVWVYSPVQKPRVPSVIISEDNGTTWNDYDIAANDTMFMVGGTFMVMPEGEYAGNIVSVGYDINKKSMNQATYTYDDAADLEAGLPFQFTETNITNNTPIGLSAPELIYNPVTQRVELIEAFNHQLVLWSIAPADLFAGSAEWTQECTLLFRGERYADFADVHAFGSIVDANEGVQRIYLSMGAKSPSRKAIYCLTRDLNTADLSSWITNVRAAAPQGN